MGFNCAAAANLGDIGYFTDNSFNKAGNKMKFSPPLPWAVRFRNTQQVIALFYSLQNAEFFRDVCIRSYGTQMDIIPWDKI